MGRPRILRTLQGVLAVYCYIIPPTHCQHNHHGFCPARYRSRWRPCGLQRPRKKEKKKKTPWPKGSTTIRLTRGQLYLNPDYIVIHLYITMFFHQDNVRPSIASVMSRSINRTLGENPGCLLFLFISSNVFLSFSPHVVYLMFQESKALAIAHSLALCVWY